MANYYNASLRNLTYRLRKFKDILDQELKEEILRNEDVIIRMIADDQLYEQGIEGRGTSIMEYMPYTIRTIKNKQKKGQPYDRVTLRDTGKFHNSLRVEFDDNGFYVVSTDDKAPELLEKYGKTIFRLTNKNLSTLIREHIRPSLQEKLKKYIING
jgi:hypothetical protein